MCIHQYVIYTHGACRSIVGCPRLDKRGQSCKCVCGQSSQMKLSKSVEKVRGHYTH